MYTFAFGEAVWRSPHPSGGQYGGVITASVSLAHHDDKRATAAGAKAAPRPGHCRTRMRWGPS
jgi:hypothetical protein